MLRIENTKIYEDLQEEDLITKILNKNKVSKKDLVTYNIVKKSIDARDKSNVHYNYTLDIEVKDENKYKYLKHLPRKEKQKVSVNRKSKYNPIIIGSGPAGLFCALTLVNHGLKPIIVEQGESVEKRLSCVNKARQTGIINPQCNVQFGEGGAGTFSDGKLTTGLNSPHIKTVLDTFYKFGAPKEILYLNKPHIGTDNLVKIIKNIRQYIGDVSN